MSSFNVGDSVKLVENTSQIGTVIRTNLLGVSNSVVVEWNEGPLFSAGTKVAYFGNNISKIELNV